MPSDPTAPRFELVYWPVPFRGSFVSYMFAYRGVALLERASLEEIEEMQRLSPREQEIPFIGPPVLRDLQSGRTLSQMPAIVLFAARELDLLPEAEDHFDVALCMKVLMDCNDVLTEICRYNGSYMWTHAQWREFRSQRLPRWMQVFEESLSRGAFAGGRVTFADIAVYALFGNMLRCLPELDPDLRANAPGVHAWCRDFGSHPTLAACVAREEARFGKLYCGGFIEASIREMIALDAAEQGR